MASPYALDFSPLSQSIQNNNQLGLQKNRLAMEEERLGFERELHPLRLQSQRQEMEQQAKTHPLQLRQMTAQVTAAEAEAKQRAYQRGLAFIESQAENFEKLPPELKAKHWNTFTSSALFDAEDKKQFEHPIYGPMWKDPDTGYRMLKSMASKYRDPLETRIATAGALEKEADAKLKNAQAGAVGTKGAGFDNFKDLVKYEQDLREEFTKQPAVKEYGVVRDAYSKIKSAAADKTAASDISLIFAYMKMLDPNSTVRETEYANAQNATGVPGQIQNLYNRIKDGVRLNPEQRLDFTKQAENLYGVHDRQYGALRGQYGNLAQRAGIDPRRITLDYGRMDADKVNPYGSGPARPQAQPAPGAVPQALQPRAAVPQQEGQPTVQGAIPPGSVRLLQQNATNPAIIEQFEQMYGPGSAKQFLEQR